MSGGEKKIKIPGMYIYLCVRFKFRVTEFNETTTCEVCLYFYKPRARSRI